VKLCKELVEQNRSTHLASLAKATALSTSPS
jgi:hypothetical protein